MFIIQVKITHFPLITSFDTLNRIKPRSILVLTQYITAQLEDIYLTFNIISK